MSEYFVLRSEKFTVILVHRTVQEAIEQAGIGSVTFVRPEDFMAL